MRLRSDLAITSILKNYRNKCRKLCINQLYSHPHTPERLFFHAVDWSKAAQAPFFNKPSGSRKSTATLTDAAHEYVYIEEIEQVRKVGFWSTNLFKVFIVIPFYFQSIQAKKYTVSNFPASSFEAQLQVICPESKGDALG